MYKINVFVVHNNLNITVNLSNINIGTNLNKKSRYLNMTFLSGLA